MWEFNDPDPVKLIVGILAADDKCLQRAVEALAGEIGEIDLYSDIWPFTQTTYYKKETGSNILRQFVSFLEPIDPGTLADIKHKTNDIEQQLAAELETDFARPVNLDPGLIEPSKLVLASTKNFCHRIYIGKKIYAELTLVYERAKWRTTYFTYPDYRQECYIEFFEKNRIRLLEQLKSQR